MKYVYLFSAPCRLPVCLMTSSSWLVAWKSTTGESLLVALRLCERCIYTHALMCYYIVFSLSQAIFRPVFLPIWARIRVSHVHGRTGLCKRAGGCIFTLMMGWEK